MSEERWVEVDGGRIAFDVSGEGPGVVLLHGGLWDRRTWDAQIDVLAERSTVVRYDLRGFGRSSTPETPYSDLDDLRAVMDAAGLERAALVGCSVGGLVATMFAIERPARVRGLVLASSGLYGHRWAVGERWERHGEEVEAALARGDLRTAVELDLRPWVPMGTDDPAGARLRTIALDNERQLTVDEDLSTAPDWTSAERLEEIRTPTLVLEGEQDVPEFREIARILADRIPGARLATIADADHVVHVRQPGEFNRLVAGFLAEL